MAGKWDRSHLFIEGIRLFGLTGMHRVALALSKCDRLTKTDISEFFKNTSLISIILQSIICKNIYVI